MKKRVRYILAASAIILVLGSAISGTAAYLTGMFGLTNVFTMADVKPEITENFDGMEKTNVAVQNKGNVPVYIRCRVTAYKEYKDGSIDNEIPILGRDYTITYPAALNSDWLLIDRIYYYRKPLQAGEKTGNLIDRAELKQKGIVLDISAQSIQAEPADAVHEAWKVVKADENGNLVPSTPVSP